MLEMNTVAGIVRTRTSAATPPTTAIPAGGACGREQDVFRQVRVRLMRFEGWFGQWLRSRRRPNQ